MALDLLPNAEAASLSSASSVNQIRTVEGRVALRYWEAIRKILPEHLDFRTRSTTTHQNNASDCVNVALNYAFSILESEVRRAINLVGLEPSLGFLHNVAQSLVYDLQEPFRVRRSSASTRAHSTHYANTSARNSRSNYTGRLWRNCNLQGTKIC
jgi:CRISPR-associated endonuclease Cas1